jgi:hypothetical protein
MRVTLSGRRFTYQRKLKKKKKKKLERKAYLCGWIVVVAWLGSSATDKMGRERERERERKRENER